VKREEGKSVKSEEGREKRGTGGKAAESTLHSFLFTLHF
jgi:hypothetical protein